MTMRRYLSGVACELVEIRFQLKSHIARPDKKKSLMKLNGHRRQNRTRYFENDNIKGATGMTNLIRIEIIVCAFYFHGFPARTPARSIIIYTTLR